MTDSPTKLISGHKWTGRRYKAIACCECGWECRDESRDKCQAQHTAHLASVARAAQKGEATQGAINISPIIMQQNVQAESALPAIPSALETDVATKTFYEKEIRRVAKEMYGVEIDNQPWGVQEMMGLCCSAILERYDMEREIEIRKQAFWIASTHWPDFSSATGWECSCGCKVVGKAGWQEHIRSLISKHQEGAGKGEKKR